MNFNCLFKTMETSFELIMEIGEELQFCRKTHSFLEIQLWFDYFISKIIMSINHQYWKSQSYSICTIG